MLRCSLVTLLVMGLLMRVAFAQSLPPGGEAAKNEARALFDEGVELLAKQSNDTALAKFQLSKKAFPTRSAGLNIAVTLKVLGRHDEALDEIDATLRDFPTMKEEERRNLFRLADTIAERVGYIVLRSAEPGATVFVEGRQRGTTPLANIRSTAGPRRVRVTKAGFEAKETTVDVPEKGGQVAVDLSPAPLIKSGRLRVTEAEGRTIAIVIDGEVKGTTPWEGAVATGQHSVQLRGDDSLGSALASVDIAEQRSATLTLLAEPMRCRLRIAPTPAHARVTIDGVIVGTGAWLGALRCGGHRIDVTATDFVEATQSISLSEERESHARVVLERDPGYGKIPTRIFVSAAAGVAIAPSFGGAPSAACGAGCSSAPGVGAFVSADAGVRFGTGFGVAITGGYLSLRKAYGARSASATPVGGSPNEGTSDDSYSVSGPRVGVTASFERGVRWKYGARISGGALFARWAAERAISLTTASGDIMAYRLPVALEQGSALTAFVEPGIAVGYEVTPRVTLDLALSGLFVFGLGGVTSNLSNKYHAGVCNTDAERADPKRCQDVLTFTSDTLFGSPIFAGTLSAGVTARF